MSRYVGLQHIDDKDTRRDRYQTPHLVQLLPTLNVSQVFHANRGYLPILAIHLVPYHTQSGFPAAHYSQLFSNGSLFFR
jgi:hypothetical protein